MSPSPADPAPRAADWEAFYRDYRKPGYIAGFEITSKLGGGMFGLVFRARRMSIGKDYAIKFLQVDDVQVQKAVLGELEQVKYFAQIDHPNLVAIEDRGEVDGIPYLVMAFAGTETLRDKMPTGREPTPVEKDELLRYFLQCCRGLAALHERSLVHFDIKPANVFLKGGVARLGDYGLSKLVTHSRGSLSMGRGTPYYMAPELLQRRGDHRSDIYSLGILLYELLCGKVPFTGDSEWEVLRQHETAQPQLPPQLLPRERAVLQRCLHKDPDARFQSVHDLIAAFGAPASAGAAAWSDVRTGVGGVGASNPPPPPRAAGAAPPPLPKPGVAGPDAEDPVAGLGRASREALKHASVLAQKAARQAGALAQQAATSAQRAVREAMQPGRGNGLRSLFSFGRRRRAATVPVPVPVPVPPRPRRRGRLLLPVAVVIGTFVLAVLFVTPARGPMLVASASSPASPDVPYPPEPLAVTVPGDATALFRVFQLPRGLDAHVAQSEPDWVRSAVQDPQRAKAELLARIEQLREVAPLSEAARRVAVEVPRFTANEVLLRGRGELDRQLQQLLDGAEFDEDLAQRLSALAPRSLVAAAEALARIEWRQPRDYECAVRLQRLLEQATGCHDLRIYGAADDSSAELAAQNRHLGSLWLWFLNEFAHTPRAWRTFVQLMPPR